MDGSTTRRADDDAADMQIGVVVVHRALVVVVVVDFAASNKRCFINSRGIIIRRHVVDARKSVIIAVLNVLFVACFIALRDVIGATAVSTQVNDRV